MSNTPSGNAIRTTVRKKIADQLRGSGLLELACPTPQCRTQIFTTWTVDLTCNRCGQRVQSIYDLQRPWKK